MEYKVRLKPRAKRFILSQPAKVCNQLIGQLDRLAKDPIPGNATLLDIDRQIYRLKYKKCRILYQVQEQKLIVLVVSVGDRKEVEHFHKELTKIMKKRSSK